MKDLSGKVALVTGGASGIGLGIAKALAGAGMRVIIASRRSESLEEGLAELAPHAREEVRALRLDVTDRQSLARVASEIATSFGNVHVLCNSAGVNLLGPMDRATYADWDWIMGVNVGGIINVLTTFLPGMKAHGEGGHVINVASMSSFISGPGAGIYTTSKFAVRGLSESLRYALAPHGIGVTMVCPGLTRSNIYKAPLSRPAEFADSGVPVDAESIKRLEQVHSVGMDPDEVGRKTLDGIRRNAFYVFSHPEFREEVGEISQRVLAAFTTEPVDPRRLNVEQMRRRAKAQAEAFAEDQPLASARP